MSSVEWLTDAEWTCIQPLLPSGNRGARRVDDRRVISGILHVLRTGTPWRKCPAEFGPYITIYARYKRWSRSGLWQQMQESLVEHAKTHASADDVAALFSWTPRRRGRGISKRPRLELH